MAGGDWVVGIVRGVVTEGKGRSGTVWCRRIEATNEITGLKKQQEITQFYEMKPRLVATNKMPFLFSSSIIITEASSFVQ